MDRINNNIMSNKNIAFGNLYATKKGAYELVDSFKDRDLLKRLVENAKNNISADVFVNDSEILVSPHKLTDKPKMRIKGLCKNFGYFYTDGYIVDYFAHDIYKPAKNAYYSITNFNIPDFRYFEPKNEIFDFGKLFVAACHIAADIDCSFHNKILEALEKEKVLSAIVKELGINIVD